MSLFERLKADCPVVWNNYIDHEFTRGVGNGSLSKDAFLRYLAQDYLFLIEFSRAYALSIYKSNTLDQMKRGLKGVQSILDTEMQLHVRFSEKWGIHEQDLVNTKPEIATTAYTQFVLHSGMKGDLLDLKVALAPCVIGYAEIGRSLLQSSNATGAENPFNDWILEYAGEEYQNLANEAIQELDLLASEYMTEQRYSRVLEIFEKATQLEVNFWDMGLGR
ncbi:thiaminase II [Flexibacterium corallicola]|uniref:thiaminase II n=1 Tax=Flexibacterium corallicola TaxID=3037259 RepID=UPI00286F8D39|nr:thiaminase II [Pseudovibrio sp. M1P-2-3]